MAESPWFAAASINPAGLKSPSEAFEWVCKSTIGVIVPQRAEKMTFSVKLSGYFAEAGQKKGIFADNSRIGVCDR
jgi:hypothetical protein